VAAALVDFDDNALSLVRVDSSNRSGALQSSLQKLKGPEMVTDPRLQQRQYQPNQGIKDAVNEAKEVVLGMIRDPLARNVEVMQAPVPRQGHAELPGYAKNRPAAVGIVCRRSLMLATALTSLLFCYRPMDQHHRKLLNSAGKREDNGPRPTTAHRDPIKGAPRHGRIVG
jgi:hypothetical protein